MSATEPEVISLQLPAVFLADLHISGNDAAAARLHGFIETLPRTVSLIFVGDVVDFWLEGPHFDLRTEYPVLEELRGRTSYFIKGNRDFLIGEKWEEATSGRVLGDRAVFEVGGKRVVVLHGDALVRADWRYQLWRRFCRTRAFALAAGCFGAVRGKGIAQRLKVESAREISRKPVRDMMIDMSEVERELRDGEMVVCGHTHVPERTTFASGELIVLGPWDKSAEVLVADEAGFHFLSADAVVLQSDKSTFS